MEAVTMPYTDDDLLNPEKDDELVVSALTAMPAAAEAAPEESGLERLRQLIAARQQQSGPGSEEQRYLAENQPQAGWKNTLGAIGAAIAESTGSHGALARFQQVRQQAQQQRAAGLAAARDADRGRRPVDAATAELGYQQGLSPEGANSLTNDSPGLKLLMSGRGYSRPLGEQKDADRELKGDLQEDRQQHQVEMETQRQTGREKLAAMRKKPAGGGGGGAFTPEQLAQGRVTHLRMSTGADPATVDAYVAGTTEGIEPAKLAALQNQDQVWAMQPARKKAELLQKQGLTEANNNDALAKAVELKKRDPSKRIEYRREIDESKALIREADLAWQGMSPEGKQALAQLSGESWASGALRDAKMSPEDQAKAGAIQALANRLIKQTSGAAVSDSEWTRIAREMGLASNNFDVLKGTGAIDKWLQRSKGAWKRNRDAVVGEMGDLWAK